ncbi:MAG: ATP-binding protein, partial [Rubrobacter sp.]
LVDGAARLADALLSACPNLKILATSREPLYVPGEALWLVPPLSLPDADGTPTVEGLMRFEAARLFVDRARSRRPAFELTEKNARAVAEVCRKLDGIPLAIELATARMGALAVEQVAERLEDSLKLLTGGVRTVAPRHQTMRATIAWSHELLPEPEKELLAKLSVFAGGWTLEAAEAVCPEFDEGRFSTLDLLARLVDKSLVLVTGRGGEARYRLLETVRQYASGKLESGGEGDVVRQRHALFFLDLAERAERESSGAGQAAWLERLEGELDNLRAATGWFLESGQSKPHLRLAGALWCYCYLHGHYCEGQGWLEGALDGGGAAPPSFGAEAPLGADVLEALAEAYCAQGRLEPAARLFGCAQTVREFVSVPVPLEERADREESISATRTGMGEAAFQAAWSEGRAMSPEQAIEYTLGGRTEEPPAAAPTATTTPVAPESPAGSSEKPAETIQAQPTADGTPALRIFALGPARVQKDGHSLSSSPDWIHKPRELLFFLLSHPKGRTKEQIGLALWPEASNSQLRSSFHDTVFRLRRALGAKGWVSFEKGRYSFERSLAYSFDAESFEEHLSEAQRLRSLSPDEAIGHLEKATDLYKGDFLEDSAFGEWAMERQEEMRREYQDALMLLGGLLFDGGRHAEAARAYRKAIAHDGFMEEAHRGLMRSYGALGERGRALRHYEGLVGMLAEKLGAPPAPETEALHERLRAGEEV